jgi:hypothetical protein
MLDPEKVRQQFNRDLASDPWTAARYIVGEPVSRQGVGMDFGLGLPVYSKETGEMATWVACPPDGIPAEVAISADSLQQLIEEDHAPWPRCPADGHEHALGAHVVAGKAMWLCGSDESVRFAIGSFPHAEHAARADG